MMSLLLAIAVAAGSTSLLSTPDGVDACRTFSEAPAISLVDAAMSGDADRVRLLIENGANPNATGKAGVTPLLCAAYAFQIDAFEAALAMGADPNQRTQSGRSALSFSILMRDQRFLSSALKHGGDPNFVESSTGSGILFRAIMPGNLEAVRMLVAAGANVNERDWSGGTPASVAADVRLFDILLYLLEAGADPCIEDRWGTTVVSTVMDPKLHPEDPAYRRVVDLLRSWGKTDCR